MPASVVRRSIAAACLTALAALACALVATPGAEGSSNLDKKDRKTRHVLFVGNNWDGTIDVFHPRGKFRKITRINAIPDLEERELEVLTDPVRAGYFLAIRALIGEGHDQYVDDMYTSNDGRLIVASRPSFRDVVAIDLNTREIVWRFVVDGQRSDHMAVSPDGKHVAVSASTGNVVHVLDIETGEEVGVFNSGDSPHENIYSADGERIYHASIGLVYTPADDPTVDTTKGDRFFQIVDADTNEVIKRIDVSEKLAEAGFPNMSSAVRPMTITENERFVYFQVSFFHGFVEYDLKKDKVRRLARLPLGKGVENIPRALYLLDSAHHGISLNRKDSRICVAGTMSDYAAIVSRKTFRYKIASRGTKPYWATRSNNGKYCFVSYSGDDEVAIISFKKKKEIKRIKVGFHPQRVRQGVVTPAWIKRNQGN